MNSHFKNRLLIALAFICLSAQALADRSMVLDPESNAAQDVSLVEMLYPEVIKNASEADPFDTPQVGKGWFEPGDGFLAFYGHFDVRTTQRKSVLGIGARFQQ